MADKLPTFGTSEKVTLNGGISITPPATFNQGSTFTSGSLSLNNGAITMANAGFVTPSQIKLGGTNASLNVAVDSPLQPKPIKSEAEETMDAYAEADRLALQAAIEADKANPKKAKAAAALEKVVKGDTTTASASAKSIDNLTAVDSYLKNYLRGLAASSDVLSKELRETSKQLAGGINNTSKALTGSIGALKTKLHEALKPMSSATGSTLGTLTQMAKDPLGAPFVLANTMSAMVDKINPGFTNKLDSVFKKYKIDNLKNLPSQMYGSLRSLASTVDQILAVPFGLAADLYNGLMEIMEAIADLIDDLASAVMDFIFGPEGLLDSILPITEVTEFLAALDEVSGQISVISNVFGGNNFLSNINSQLNSFTSQAQGILNKPVELARSYLAEVTGPLNSLRNPEQFLGTLLPKGLNEQLRKISSIPGLGAVGNLGYGIGSTLETFKTGIFTSMLDSYSSQLPIFASMFNRANTNAPVPSYRDPYKDGYQTSPITDKPVAQGQPAVRSTSQYKIFADQTAQQPTAQTGGSFSPVPVAVA